RMTAANHTALFLDQAQALFLDPALLGGKAANLAWLSREGLPVPRWWVLTTEAFRVLLDSNDLSAWIDAQLARIGTGEDSALLEGVARDIQQRVLAARLPDGLRETIATALRGHEDQYFAVRSSV